MAKPDIAVIGAGPAGLSVAYFLTKTGFSPTVYEGGQDVGGLAGSISLWGKSYDIGPHIFLESCDQFAVSAWNELGGDDMQRIRLRRGMIIKNKLMHFPPSPLQLLKVLGLAGSLRAGIDLFRSRLSPPKKVSDSGSFFSKRFGNHFRSILFDPFCQKYMGLPDREVDLAFATGLTSFVKDHTAAGKTPGQDKSQTILYPRQGTKSIWLKMAEVIKTRGQIEFGKKLQKVVTEENRIKALVFNDGSIVHPDMVVSSLPLAAFLRLLDHCPDNILAEAEKLFSRSTVLVYLKLKRPSFKYQYITIFDHSLELGRITNFSNWFEKSPDETVLCLEYWCSLSSDVWHCSKETLVSKAIAEVIEAGLINDNEVLAAEIMRLPYSHPVLSKNYESSLAKINNYLSRYQNLIISGRHASFKWDGQADNILNGKNLAEKVKAWFGVGCS